jgi:hypothetical protein
MKKAIHLLTLTMLLVTTPLAHALITTTPSSISVPRAKQSTRTVTFNISTIYAAAVSERGIFFAGQQEIGSIERVLVPSLSGPQLGIYTGSVSETITIPAKVLRRARQLGVNRIQYRRNFVAAGVPHWGRLEIRITSAGAADFAITAMRLYFDNQRAQTMVYQKTPGLQAYADLSIVGAGYLQAYWEVDGRVLTPRINRYVRSGKKVTLASPPKPGLPTFLGGTHEVRLVIVSPEHELDLPRALYYVTSVPSETQTQILLTNPQGGVALEWAPVPFAWIEEPSLTTYLIEFVEEGQEAPVFSAYVNQGAYTLPQPVLNHFFSPRRTYRWRVRGFDADNNPAGVSDGRDFVLK